MSKTHTLKMPLTMYTANENSNKIKNEKFTFTVYFICHCCSFVLFKIIVVEQWLSIKYKLYFVT